VQDQISFDLPTLGYDGGGVTDYHGSVVAIGDFDGDLFEDLAVSASGAKVDGQEFAGVVHVLYGSADGLDPWSASAVQLLHRNVPEMVGSAEPHDSFGRALAAGDFDCDGRDDLAVGVRKPSNVHVIYGSSSGLDPQAGPFNHVLPLYGDAMATGNFDGNYGPNACMDLVVGGDGLAVIHGMPDVGLQVMPMPSATFDLANPAFGADRGSNEFGDALSVGRFDSHPYDDLVASYDGGAILMPGSGAGLTAAGSVNVFIGHHGGPITVGYGNFDDDGAGDVVIGEVDDEIGKCDASSDACDAGELHVGYMEKGAAIAIDAMESWTSDDIPGEKADDYEGLGKSVTKGRSVYRPLCTAPYPFELDLP
jgi:hypothetical protein